MKTDSVFFGLDLQSLFFTPADPGSEPFAEEVSAAFAAPFTPPLPSQLEP
jgi:hypothetical protein